MGGDAQRNLLPRLNRNARRLSPEGPHAFDYECGLDELVAELLTVKEALLGMGQRVREVALARGQGAEGDGGGVAAEDPVEE